MRRSVVLFVALGISRSVAAQPAPNTAELTASPPAESAAPNAPADASAEPAPAAPDVPEVPTAPLNATVPAAETSPPPEQTPPSEVPTTAPKAPAHVPPAPAESDARRAVLTPPARPRDFGLELDLALNTRLGRSGTYAHEEAFGAHYGVGAWLGLGHHTELGLELTRTELGRVSNESGRDLVWAEYAVTSLWLGGRFEPFRSKDIATFVALRLGLGMQSLDARGARAGGPLLAPAETYACSETDGPGIALGGGGGAAWLLGPRVQLIGRLDANAHRMQGDWLGSCAPGIGSVTSVSVGLGIAYGFET